MPFIVEAESSNFASLGSVTRTDPLTVLAWRIAESERLCIATSIFPLTLSADTPLLAPRTRTAPLTLWASRAASRPSARTSPLTVRRAARTPAGTTTW